MSNMETYEVKNNSGAVVCTFEAEEAVYWVHRKIKRNDSGRSLAMWLDDVLRELVNFDFAPADILEYEDMKAHSAWLENWDPKRYALWLEAAGLIKEEVTSTWVLSE